MAPIFRTKFHHEWLFDPKYSKWIMPDESSDNSVKCKVCICYIDLSNMGKASLDSHMKSKKHQSRIKEFNKTVPVFNSWIKYYEYLYNKYKIRIYIIIQILSFTKTAILYQRYHFTFFN